MKKFSLTKKANSRRNSLPDPRTIFVVGGILFLILLAFVLPRAVRSLAEIALSPFVLVSDWIRESPTVLPVYVRDRTEILQERNDLLAQLDATLAASLSSRRLMEENILLRTFLNESVPERLLSRVVARPPYLPYDLIQIDKGTEAGVEIGDPVFVGQDVVIGAVVEVGSAYAYVQLVTAAGFESTVYVPEAKLAAKMEGQGGGVARIRFAQGIRIEPGYLVILLANGGGVFGEVASVESASTQPEQYAYVTLPVSLQELRYLSVGKQPLTPPPPESIASSTQALVASYFALPEAARLLSPPSSTTASSSERNRLPSP